MCILVLTIIFLLVWNYKIAFSLNDEMKIGIIDSDLSKSSKDLDIISAENVTFSKEAHTHGDEMIKFLRDLNQEAEIYYYNAEEQEKIRTETIIDGLNWMKVNGIKYVNVSLSGKRKNKELEKWIDANYPTIKVYASYNNQLNTYDYPAGYEKAIGSGTDPRIEWGENDRKYRSNKILVLPALNQYAGNSYLSLLSLISDYE